MGYLTEFDRELAKQTGQTKLSARLVANDSSASFLTAGCPVKARIKLSAWQTLGSVLGWERRLTQVQSYPQYCTNGGTNPADRYCVVETAVQIEVTWIYADGREAGHHSVSAAGHRCGDCTPQPNLPFLEHV
jgi:hypothetical protein